MTNDNQYTTGTTPFLAFVIPVPMALLGGWVMAHSFLPGAAIFLVANLLQWKFVRQPA